jgi:tetratricopeptide (TPR) repeat protein
LLARLERALPVLTGGRRDAPERQRTLRATIEWSYELLTPEERRLFARLGVFAGSFALDAAAFVCDADLDAIESLIEQSLVRRWESGRLGMLETIRELAVERFAELPECESLRRRLFDYVLDLAQPDRELEGLTPEEIERLAAELPNIRAALAWALATDPVRCVELSVALGRFWVVRDRAEGNRWLADALAHAENAPPELRAEGLLWAASCRWLSGDFGTAEKLFEEALELFRRLGLPARVADALDRLAGTQLTLGRRDQARASAEESLRICEELGKRERTMFALSKLGHIDWQDGRREEAKAAVERSVALAREFGDTWFASSNLHSLADWALEEGELVRAAELCRESAALARELGDSRTLQYCVALFACIAAARGDEEAAGRFWGAVEALEREGQVLEPEERGRYGELVAAADGPAFSAAAEAVRDLSSADALDAALANLD